MNLMDNMIKEVEFTTSYPNRDGKGFTSITIVKLENGHRIMIWSPYIERLDTTITVKDECSEFRDCYNRPIGAILHFPYIEISGTTYASQIMKDGFYFKAICLDDNDETKKKVSKEEIEKLFNCQVVN